MPVSGPVRTARRLSLLLAAVCLLAALLASAAAAAPATGATKALTYRGYRLVVPRSWPVFHISASSTVCVRFDRHAVYLGEPGTRQLCPSQAAGRTAAILLQPESTASTGTMLMSGSVARITDPARQLAITATWRAGDSGTVAHALGLRSLAASARSSAATPAPAAAALASGTDHSRLRSLAEKASSSGTSEPGAVYDGFGFDTCATPSSSVMSAWSHSAYHAVGIYIGGANMACSQQNLTSAWVTAASRSGWHMAPIYVGLQAAGNACGCESINSADASAEGTAAADNAVSEMRALGFGTGNPVYYDMEAYNSQDASVRDAVLAFLQSWTRTLHANGYLSGVYSSDSSGIVNLTGEAGSSYAEPDDIWFANWNGEANVSDPNASSTAWPNGKRIHQYFGGYNVTEGGVMLNIDGDYLYSQTAAAGSAGAVSAGAAPSSTTSPSVYGTPLVGQVLTDRHADWSGQPSGYSYQWELCNASGAACSAISGATAKTYTVTTAAAGHTVRVIETASNAAGNGAARASAATATVAAAASGYWQFTAFGNVYNTTYEPFYGSPSASHVAVSDVVGLSATSDAEGYWLATSSGSVYGYGNALTHTGPQPTNPIIGIVASPTGRGYWLYTAQGNIYNHGTTFLGSPSSHHLRLTDVVGMAVSSGGRGYWVVTSSGKVYAYGAAGSFSGPRVTHPVTGIVADPLRTGYWLYTATGNVYNYNSVFYGSPNASHVAVSDVTGLAPTSSGHGYWLTSSTGSVDDYGDASAYVAGHGANPMIGVAAGY